MSDVSDSADSIPTASDLAKSTASVAKQHYKFAVSNVRHFVENRSKSFWIVLGLVVVLITGFLLYRWYVNRRWRLRYIDCAGCYLRFRNRIASVNEKEPIPAMRLTRSRGGFTYSMWLYVSKWYGDSSGKWKNVYYRGKEVDPTACTLQWDSIPRQNPGIWLSDDQNNLRVVVGTKVMMPEETKACLVEENQNAANSNNLAFAPTNTSVYTVKDGETLGGIAQKYNTTEDELMNLNSSSITKADDEIQSGQRIFVPKSSATDAATPKCAPSSLIKPLTSMDLLEYADIQNFPIGHWFHLVAVVTKQRIELYMNGKLVKTSVFVGVYEDDCTNRGFFSVGHPMTGRIANFRFMPHPLPFQMIQYLYATEGRQSFKTYKDPMRENENF